jgi:uncharacterized tellurite resistance protein B-like protein
MERVTQQLSQAQRQRVLKFGVSSAWADLSLDSREVAVLFDIADELALDDEGRTRFLSWLSEPPPPEEVDPTKVMQEERELCISVASRVIAADGRKTEEEEAFLALLTELLGADNRGFQTGVTQTSR